MLDCALVGIQRFAQYLAKPPSSSSRERERRALALRFLSHFVGDLHQPLHVGHIEDLGGNKISVKFTLNGQTKTDKLHAVWDSAVLRRAGLTTIQDAHDLNVEITAAEATQWATFAIADWATESEALARQKAYVKSDGSEVQENDFLDDAYFTPAIQTVKQRIKQAGVRLAMLIEAAAAGTMPAHLLNVTP
jgi:nuclease S1